MNSKEIKELKQRLTLDSCTITKMKGVYVGSNNEIVARLDKNFLNLPEDEFFKYLEYAKEIFQPKQVDNKDLTLNITGDSDIKNILNRIVDNGLKKTTTAEEELYNKIIKYYGHTNGYLILLFMISMIFLSSQGIILYRMIRKIYIDISYVQYALLS